jgi:hypothetical protein
MYSSSSVPWQAQSSHTDKDRVSMSLLAALYRVAVKSLARPGRKQARVTEDFDVHISYL